MSQRTGNLLVGLNPTHSRLHAVASIAFLSLFISSGLGCSLASRGQNITGVQLYQQGQYQQAASVFRQSIQSDPWNADGYYNLAATQYRLGRANNSSGDLQQAENLYHQALDRNPNHQPAYRGLTVLLVQQGRTDDAITMLRGWSQRSPELAAPKIELARLAEEFNQFDTAQEYLLEAASIDPHNARALAALGSLREQTGDVDQALNDYQRSLAINSRQPQIMQRVAQLSRTKGGPVSGIYNGVGAPGTTANTRLVDSNTLRLR